MADNSATATSISITNLILPVPLKIPSLFTPPSTVGCSEPHPTSDQPATLTLILHLRHPFASAASADELDTSTIHYGHLAKQIRAACASGTLRTVESVLDITEEVIVAMAKPTVTNKDFLVMKSEMAVQAMKGSMASSGGAKIVRVIKYDESGAILNREWRFEVKDMRTQTLIGVNAKERWRRQPLVVAFVISRQDGTSIPLTCWKVEETLLQILDKTAFETLESLIEHTFARLESDVLDEQLAGVALKLRLEKPQAIAFADAPAIEMIKTIRGRQHASASSSSMLGKLRIIRPYVT